MNEQHLKHSFSLVAGQVKRRLRQGKLQTWQSTDGYLALMVDKIQRYFSANGGYDELLDLCVDSVVALSTLLASSNSDGSDRTEDEDVEIERQLIAEMLPQVPPEQRQINPNALEEGEELDPRWTAKP